MPEKGYTKRKLKWTREDMLEAGKHWIETYKEVPAATDFNPGDCNYCARISFARGRRWMERAARFREGTYPWPQTVQKEFGTWANFIKELGYTPRREAIPDIRRDLPRGDVGEIKTLAAKVVTAHKAGDKKAEREMIFALIDRALLLSEEIDNA